MTITFTNTLHSGNWQRSSPILQNQQKVCQCGHNRYLVPPYGGSSPYGGENAQCMYWTCASAFHALSTFWSTLAQRDRTLLNISPVMMKYCTKHPVSSELYNEYGQFLFR